MNKIIKPRFVMELFALSILLINIDSK